jgi:hypothetical protein
MIDLKCERCGAPADFEIHTSVTAITSKAKEALAGNPSFKIVPMCMGCALEIGPGVVARIESSPAREPLQ